MAKLNDGTVILSKSPSTFTGPGWLDGSIVGNGRVGAAVLGAVANEKILINHAGLRHGGYTGVLQDVSDKFAQIRRIYNDGQVLEAEKLLSGEFAKKNYKPSPDFILPLYNLCLDFFQEGNVTEYKRVTDMAAGEVEISFKASNTHFTRRIFVGRGNDIIGFSATRNGPQFINVLLSIREIADAGSALNASVKYEGGFLYFAAKKEGGQDYGFVARVIIPNGTSEHTEKGISIKGAESLTLFAKVFTGGNREAEFKSLKSELAGIKVTYDKLQSQSEDKHRRLFNNVKLSLAAARDINASTGVLISKASEGELSPLLIERLWNFSKYMAICLDGSVMTSGGLWTSGMRDKSGVLAMNNMAQLLYGGIVASFEPDAILTLLDSFEKYSDDLKKNAARVFGARGYFIPNTVSPQSALFGSVDPQTLHFIASSAIAANLFYTHFLVEGDQKVLKAKIYPFMKEVFNFYSDFLKLDNNGFYSTIPSYSPDSTPGNTIKGKKLEDFGFATNSTIDFLAIGALLDNLIHAAEILGQDSSSVMVWKEMKTKMPQFTVNDQGCLREYTNSPFIDGIQNCGNLHCFGLYPYKTFSFNDSVVPYKPAVGGAQVESISLRRASANAIFSRLSHAGHVQNAQVLAMSAAQLAHAGEIPVVQALLTRFVGSCFTNSGLCLSNDWRGSGFTKNERPSLDIAGNFGFANAITECLVQSDRKTLRILPCPLSELAAGDIQNFATDFGARVSVEWDMKKGRLVVRILPKVTGKIDIYFNPSFKKLRNKELKLDKQNSLRDVKLVAGKAITYEFG